jgi:hypothetical protein
MCNGILEIGVMHTPLPCPPLIISLFALLQVLLPLWLCISACTGSMAMTSCTSLWSCKAWVSICVCSHSHSIQSAMCCVLMRLLPYFIWLFYGCVSAAKPCCHASTSVRVNCKLTLLHMGDLKWAKFIRSERNGRQREWLKEAQNFSRNVLSMASEEFL